MWVCTCIFTLTEMDPLQNIFGIGTYFLSHTTNVLIRRSFQLKILKIRRTKSMFNLTAVSIILKNANNPFYYYYHDEVRNTVLILLLLMILIVFENYTMAHY